MTIFVSGNPYRWQIFSQIDLKPWFLYKHPENCDQFGNPQLKPKYESNLKAGEPDSFESGSQSEGQLKERSEGGRVRWQTALGEVMAAGS